MTLFFPLKIITQVQKTALHYLFKVFSMPCAREMGDLKKQLAE